MTTQDLCQAVDDRADAMLRFLEQIVNLDSPTEDKALTDRVGDVLQARAEAIGMTAARDVQATFGDNRICRLGRSPDSGVPRVLLVGHFDTVYGAGTVAGRPFHIDGDRAFGPGAFDMKGGLTVGLFALEALWRVVPDPALAVTFVFNSDEEIGSPASRKVIVEEAARHDLALVLEPGRPGPAITIARKGVGIFRVDVEGVEAHAGIEPEKGANSIVETAAKVTALAALADPALGTSVTPGVIRGGTQPYVVPGACHLEIDCRVPTLAEQARVTAGIERIVADCAVPGTRARLSGGFHRPPMESTHQSLLHVARYREAARSTGLTLDTTTSGGASDGNTTAAAGIPTLDGLGVHGGRAHSPEEFIEIPSLAAKSKALAAFLAGLAGATPA